MSINKKIGIFVFLALLIISGITLKVKRIDFLNKTYEIYTYFDDVAGLTEGGSVRLAGVKIGYVKDVIPEDKTVKVEMSIFHRYKIQSDAEARIIMETLMTGKAVGIGFGNSNIYLKNNDYIKSGGIVDIESLIYNLTNTTKKAGELVDSFNKNQTELLGNANKFVVDNSPKLSNIISNIDEIIQVNKGDVTDIIVDIKNTTGKINRFLDNATLITENLLEGKGSAGKFLVDDSLYDELSEAVSSAKQTFNRTNSILSNNEENVNEILTSLKNSMPALQDSMNNIKTISEKITKGEGTIGKLMMDETLYNEATEAIKGINKAIDDQREQTVITTFSDIFFGMFAF